MSSVVRTALKAAEKIPAADTTHLAFALAFACLAVVGVALAVALKALT